MKSRIVSLIVGIVGVFCLIVPSVGKLYIEDLLGYENSESVSKGEDGKFAVTFSSDFGNEVKYFPAGYVLSLKDAPFTYKNGSVYTWKNGSNFLNNHFVVQGDITLEASVVSQSVSLLSEYWEEYRSNQPEKQSGVVNTDINTSTPKFNGGDAPYFAGLDNAISLSETCFWLSGGETKFHAKVDNGSTDDCLTLDYSYNNEDYMVARRNTNGVGYDFGNFGLIDFPNNHHGRQIGYYGQSYDWGSAGVTNWSFSGGTNVSYTRGHSSIGLETHDADYLPGQENKYNQYYKPINLSELSGSPWKTDAKIFGDSVEAEYQSEYCGNRLTLNCDVVFTGTSITLAGLTGFAYTVRSQSASAGDPLQWTQLNYQGFMVGSYSEIDLNGYDLIVENGSMIDSFGSITDSSIDRTGNIVLRNGSVLYTNLVQEDAWRENSLPEIYAQGMDFMQMFRCPYLDCTVICEYGSKFYGKLFLSFGASMGAFHLDVGLVGPVPDSGNPVVGDAGCFLFQMKDTGGRVIRKTYYDLDLYNEVKGSKSNTTLMNIAYQRFSWIFEDADVHIGGFYMAVDFGGNNISISSKKFSIWIPPYFDFYAYNSNVTFYQQFTFAPGCYLFADAASTLNFSNSSFYISDLILQDIGNYMSYADNQFNYCSAGLILCQDYYNLNDGNSNYQYEGNNLVKFDDSRRYGWFDTRKKEKQNNEGNGNWAFSWTNFWNYYSNKPARFDCDAKLTFASGNTAPYVLAGEINLRDNYSFLNETKNLNVDLSGCGVMTGPSTAEVGIGINLHQVNIAGFYSAPLISNGEVLAELPNSSGRQNCFYDRASGLVTDVGNGNLYAFIFDSPNDVSQNINYANNNTQNSLGTNSLSGSFKQVSDVGNHVVSYGGKHMIFYHGAFIPFRSSDSSGSIIKFTGFDSNVESGTRYVYRTFAYEQNEWKIKGSVSPGGWSW